MHTEQFFKFFFFFLPMFLFTDAIHKEKEKVSNPCIIGLLALFLDFARCAKHYTANHFSVQTGKAEAPADAHVQL